MKEKGRLEKWNIYYKIIHLHPLCDYYIRCERISGETSWYLIYKWGSYSFGKVKISRYDVRGYIKEWEEKLESYLNKKGDDDDVSTNSL